MHKSEYIENLHAPKIALHHLANELVLLAVFSKVKCMEG